MKSPGENPLQKLITSYPVFTQFVKDAVNFFFKRVKEEFNQIKIKCFANVKQINTFARTKKQGGFYLPRSFK